jgi:hypothetical protein
VDAVPGRSSDQTVLDASGVIGVAPAEQQMAEWLHTAARLPAAHLETIQVLVAGVPGLILKYVVQL